MNEGTSRKRRASAAAHWGARRGCAHAGRHCCRAELHALPATRARRRGRHRGRRGGVAWRLLGGRTQLRKAVERGSGPSWVAWHVPSGVLVGERASVPAIAPGRGWPHTSHEHCCPLGVIPAHEDTHAYVSQRRAHATILCGARRAQASTGQQARATKYMSRHQVHVELSTIHNTIAIYTRYATRRPVAQASSVTAHARRGLDSGRLSVPPYESATDTRRPTLARPNTPVATKKAEARRPSRRHRLFAPTRKNRATMSLFAPGAPTGVPRRRRGRIRKSRRGLPARPSRVRLTPRLPARAQRARPHSSLPPRRGSRCSACRAACLCRPCLDASA